MQNSLSELLSASKSILILLPTSPHFDQVAAGLSLYSTFKTEGDFKDVVIACSSPMVVEFNRLVDVDKITSELGNKNLIIKFKEYPVDDLNTVSYEIDGGEINIKVEPKPGMVAPKKEQVELSYAGIAADTVILIGGAHEGHFPALSNPEFQSTKLIHLGVRDIILPAPYKPLSLARQAASISEIVAKLIKDSKYDLSADVATNLIMGIEEGSRNFTVLETNAETFSTMAELMQLGGKRITKQDRPDRRNFPPGSIPKQSFYPVRNPNQPAPRPMQSEPMPQLTERPEVEKSDPGQEVPKSWLSSPKVYKSSQESSG